MRVLRESDKDHGAFPSLRIYARGMALTILSVMVLHSSFSRAEPPQKPIKDKHEYKPVRPEAWRIAMEHVSQKRAFLVLQSEPPPADSSPMEVDEWRLMIANALAASDMPIHAQFLLMNVASRSVGTRQGFEALRTLVRISKDDMIDEAALEDFAFDLDTKIDEPESRSMIGYLRARTLLRKGYPDWSKRSLNEIQAGSVWSEELKYDRTLQALNLGDSPSAYVNFEALSRNANARAQTVLAARLALARLIFERRDYSAAITTYVSIDLPTRERARSFNELAWTYYYDRAYGKSLGAIEALKSPYFRPLLSPETLLVEMLIYRELCRFQKVKDLVADFLVEYREVYEAIEGRKPLDKIRVLLQMALQEGILQKRANAIQFLRLERREIEGRAWLDGDLQSEVLRFGEKRERLLSAEIDRMVRSRVDALANWFLDLREQVRFLEYESSMRMIQLNDEQVEKYTPPKADAIRPNVMFWPVSSEAWLDELLNYEVLVGDQCQANSFRAPFMIPGPGGRK